MSFVSHQIFHSCVCHFSPNCLTQTAQNGSGGGQSIDTAVYQQGAAVTYSQEGHEYSGPDSTAFKAQTDARVPALPGAGAALMGAYTGAAAPGWYRICRPCCPCDLCSYVKSTNRCGWLSMCSCHFIGGSDIWINSGTADSYTGCSRNHSCRRTSHTGTTLDLHAVDLCINSSVMVRFKQLCLTAG